MDKTAAVAGSGKRMCAFLEVLAASKITNIALANSVDVGVLGWHMKFAKNPFAIVAIVLMHIFSCGITAIIHLVVHLRFDKSHGAVYVAYFARVAARRQQTPQGSGGNGAENPTASGHDAAQQPSVITAGANPPPPPPTPSPPNTPATQQLQQPPPTPPATSQSGTTGTQQPQPPPQQLIQPAPPQTTGTPPTLVERIDQLRKFALEQEREAIGNIFGCHRFGRLARSNTPIRNCYNWGMIGETLDYLGRSESSRSIGWAQKFLAGLEGFKANQKQVLIIDLIEPYYADEIALKIARRHFRAPGLEGEDQDVIDAIGLKYRIEWLIGELRTAVAKLTKSSRGDIAELSKAKKALSDMVGLKSALSAEPAKWFSVSKLFTEADLKCMHEARTELLALREKVATDDIHAAATDHLAKLSDIAATAATKITAIAQTDPPWAQKNRELLARVKQLSDSIHTELITEGDAVLADGIDYATLYGKCAMCRSLEVIWCSLGWLSSPLRSELSWNPQFEHVIADKEWAKEFLAMLETGEKSEQSYHETITKYETQLVALVSRGVRYVASYGATDPDAKSANAIGCCLRCLQRKIDSLCAPLILSLKESSSHSVQQFLKSLQQIDLIYVCEDMPQVDSDKERQTAGHLWHLKLIRRLLFSAEYAITQTKETNRSAEDVISQEELQTIVDASTRLFAYDGTTGDPEALKSIYEELKRTVGVIMERYKDAVEAAESGGTS
ncbi:MAG: hypothetical protein LBB38_00205 [Puniceicoccales bacterium]|jgi:hypothetical protein|nr:hypothetical protein [Puniceicoccales bacterium]